MQNSSFDILIIGASVVGLTQALLCAQSQYSVGLIEANDPSSHLSTHAYDPRVFAITRAAQNVFRSIGCWEGMAQDRVSPYHCMRVWDAEGFGSLAFHADEISEPDLGHIIEYRVMMKALWRAVQHSRNIHMIHGKPKSLNQDDKKVELSLESPSFLHGRLIIGSDGGNSWLRSALGLPTEVADYSQSSLVATVQTLKPHEFTAWQRFLPEGPLAFLPLSDPNTCSIVFTSSPEKIQQYETMPDSDFLDLLGHSFDYRLGPILQVSERRSFPLKRLLVKRTTHDRGVVIGDAAHIIHPLAGQGLNLGILDADCLGTQLKNLRQACQSKAHFDAYGKEYHFMEQKDCIMALLKRYDRMRKAPVQGMMALTDSLRHLFSMPSTFMSSLRNLALNFVDKNAFIKHKLMRVAMGLDHAMSEKTVLDEQQFGEENQPL